MITGGGLGGDLKPKEVVSMLLDDGEVEEKRMLHHPIFIPIYILIDTDLHMILQIDLHIF